MDWEEGLKRLTVFLSILAGICVCIYLAAINEIVAVIVFMIALLFLEVISSFAVRGMHGVIRWVVKRFRADKPKDEKDNKQIETPNPNGAKNRTLHF